MNALPHAMPARLPPSAEVIAAAGSGRREGRGGEGRGGAERSGGAWVWLCNSQGRHLEKLCSALVVGEQSTGRHAALSRRALPCPALPCPAPPWLSVSSVTYSCRTPGHPRSPSRPRPTLIVFSPPPLSQLLAQLTDSCQSLGHVTPRCGALSKCSISFL